MNTEYPEIKFLEIKLKDNTKLYINLDKVERIVVTPDNSEIRFVYANVVSKDDLKDVVPIKTKDIENIRKIEELSALEEILWEFVENE